MHIARPLPVTPWLNQVASQLSAAKRRLLLAVPPLVPAPGRPAQLTAEDAEELLALSDGLSGERLLPE